MKQFTKFSQNRLKIATKMGYTDKVVRKKKGKY